MTDREGAGILAVKLHGSSDEPYQPINERATMSHQLLTQALAHFPTPKMKKFNREWWGEAFLQLRQYLHSLSASERREIFSAAVQRSLLQDLIGFERLYIRFFHHPCFEIFEAFWQDEALYSYFSEYFRVYVRHSYGTCLPSGRQFKKQVERLDTMRFARHYVTLLRSHYRFFSLRGEKDPTDRICLLSGDCVPSTESAWRIFEKEERSAAIQVRRDIESRLRLLCERSYKYKDLFNLGLLEGSQISQLELGPDDLLSQLEVSGFVLKIPKELRSLDDFPRILSGTLKRGFWPSFTVNVDPIEAPVLLASTVKYEANPGILRYLEDVYIETLSRLRRVEHGRLPIGLKIHCAKKWTPGDDFLRSGNFTAHNAGRCFNIPPVGSIRSVTELFRNIEIRTGVKFLDNPNFQIQVCSPGELNARNAAILGITCYLGSDQLRIFQRGDFVTSHPDDTGDRLIIYGAGVLDPYFEWWDTKNGALFRDSQVPRVMEDTRTDVLGCKSLRDIANVNLVATLLVHAQYGGYWQTLGEKFISEMERVLESHFLSHLLEVNWVKGSDLWDKGDELFYQALEELSTYAFEEAERIAKAYENEKWTETRKGILFQVADLLDDYRHEVEFRSVNWSVQ